MQTPYPTPAAPAVHPIFAGILRSFTSTWSVRSEPSPAPVLPLCINLHIDQVVGDWPKAPAALARALHLELELNDFHSESADADKAQTFARNLLAARTGCNIPSNRVERALRLTTWRWCRYLLRLQIAEPISTPLREVCRRIDGLISQAIGDDQNPLDAAGWQREFDQVPHTPNTSCEADQRAAPVARRVASLMSGDVSLADSLLTVAAVDPIGASATFLNVYREELAEQLCRQTSLFESMGYHSHLGGRGYRSAGAMSFFHDSLLGEFCGKAMLTAIFALYLEALKLLVPEQ